MQAKKRLVLLFAIVFLLQLFSFSMFHIHAQKNYNRYTISLLTYSPGDKLYSVFGHSAIKITGPNNNWVYNYGTFNFDDPGFYFKFIQGKLMYRLSRVSFDYVRKMNRKENRSLVETPLSLNEEQKGKMIRYLDMNYLPENQSYQYDFFYNNCATKIIDAINYSTSNLSAYNPMASPQKSFRRLMDPYLEVRPWIHIGTDFLMGLPANKICDGTEASFLPDYLHLLIKNAKVSELSGTTSNLSLPDKIHYQQLIRDEKIRLKPKWILWPLVLICIISLILDTHFSIVFRWLNNVVIIGFGILGVILVVLWIVPNHYIFNFNPDVLWANPLLLPAFFIISRHQGNEQNKINTFFLHCLLIMASIGSLAGILLERNMNLTALSLLVLIALFDLVRSVKTD